MAIDGLGPEDLARLDELAALENPPRPHADVAREAIRMWHAHVMNVRRRDAARGYSADADAATKQLHGR